MMNQQLLQDFLQVPSAYKSQTITGKGSFTFISNQTGIP